MTTNKQDEEKVMIMSRKYSQGIDEMDDEDNGVDFSKCLVISESSTFTVIWNFANIILSITSSYTFILLACFGEEKDENARASSRNLNLLFEVFFFISMMLRFITDYTEEGESQPEKSLSKIAKRYFHSWAFVLDLLP